MNSAISTDPIFETLAGQSIGRRLTIQGFDLPGDIQQRLQEMGLTIGTECIVTRYAPLRDPMEIRVRGYLLVLRSADAQGVKVLAI